MKNIPLYFLLLNSLITFSQQTDYLDIKSADIMLHFDTENEKVLGEVIYSFELMEQMDSIYFDAKNFEKVEVINIMHPIGFRYNGEKISVKTLKERKGFIHTLKIKWETTPPTALYFIGWNNEGRNQIWTQGQGKYTSNWLPSLDDVNDKIEFDLTVTFDSNYEVLANGELRDVYEKDSTKTWRFNMEKPMSSYLLALAIGRYDKQTEYSKSGIPLEYYYYPQDSLKVEPTYRYTKEIFDFLEDEIGVAYPWEIYKQVPVKDFLYSGMENTSMTIFSDAFVVDAIGYNDRSYVTVNAHEMAHQWFGNLVTATSGEHHWLQEGFATYYALLAEKHLFGDNHFYWQLYENAQELLDQQRAGQSTSLLDPKSSSTTFYKKGAWALHILRERIGDDAFKEAVKNYLNNHAFNSVNTEDFISEAEKSSGEDLGNFVKTWLEDVDLPEDAMVKSLNKSYFIQEYLMVDCEAYTSKCKDYLVSDISDEAKIKVVAQNPDKITNDDFHNSLKVRQAIAQYVTAIPLDLKSSYESLLKDKSYLTKEFALYNLWNNFPQDRSKYLKATEQVYGFNDYNVRLLWIALHLNTIEYQPEKKEQLFEELLSYTEPNYNFELRMNTFVYLKLLGGFNEFAIGNLIDAKTHHNWRFQKFAKELLEELKRDEGFREIVERLEKDRE